ncbi:uncharacterized protein GIQ15_06962 [Arthroderma uncinatum]|uniref:uncharacterized protein n=1 Tax=Arthroderma uncinatum TaxID=74035 RepID=UPI00144A9FF9|nr:uncharacterized protein GIQ15_06962 [Arthroderma uncinatum]KAF3479986.1 hypothetical protein GIQ15_06962 [Arthroderma uncinatum]
MAETASLVVGVVALAGLFNNAVQCFEYVQLGHGFGSNFQICQLRLDSAQLRLSRWGKSLGLDVTQPQQTLPDFPVPPAEIKLAERLLGQILESFETARLRLSQFKGRASPNDNDDDDDGNLATFDSQTHLEPAIKDAHNDMRKLTINTQKRATLKQKTKWALYEENALRQLIDNITRYIDDLTILFPAAEPRQQQLCKAEASNIKEHEDGTHLLREIAARQDKLLEAMLVKSSNNNPRPQVININVVFSGSNNKGIQIGSNSGIQNFGNVTFIMDHPTISAYFSGDENKALQFGHNSGTVNHDVHHHYQGSRPETPPEPSCKIPFDRDKEGFVDRETIFDEIKEKSEAPGSRIALVGIGGVGKSQIAIEYAYRIRDRLPDTWIFWIYASNSVRFQESLEKIAEHAKIPGRDDPKQDSSKLVYRWLCDEKRKWVIILDNADDLDFLEDVSTEGCGDDKRLGKYLPKTQSGSVIVTSRSRGTASDLVDDKYVINVDPMDETHAIDLFRKKLPKPDDGHGDKQIAELAAELEYLPLAIVQAASYISHKAPRCSVQEYLDDFRKSKADGKLRLLGETRRDQRRDEEAVNPISDTWKISFNHIRRTRPSAADLLALMCFFDRQGIPDFALPLPRKRGERGPQNKDDPSDSTPWPAARDISFENDISTLRDYCFISIRMRRVFDMHRLVQLATQQWLRNNESFERWQGIFISRLALKFPSSYEKEGWSRCQQLFPHVKYIVSHKSLRKESVSCWANLLCKAALYAYQRGNYADSVTMSTTAMDVSKATLGEQDLTTLTCQVVVRFIEPHTTEDIEKLPSKESGAGRWWEKTWAWLTRSSSALLTEEERGWLKAVEHNRRKFGPHHQLTHFAMTTLALTYSLNGRHMKAEKLLLKVVKLGTEARGFKDQDTLKNRGRLAWVYQHQGRLVEAAELQEQVANVSMVVNGPEHRDTLGYMSDLAWIQLRQGRLEQAGQLCTQVLESSKRVNGLEHPDTIEVIGELVGIYLRQDLLEQAERLCTEAVDLSKRVFEEGDERTQRYISLLDNLQRFKEMDPESRVKSLSKLNTL